MVDPLSNQIPKIREVTIGSLHRRESYTNIVSLAKNSLIFAQSLQDVSPAPLNCAISVLQIATLINIRPTFSDIRETGASVSDSFRAYDLNQVAQGMLYLSNRFILALNAYATARVGLAALAGGATYTTTLFVGGAVAVLGAFFNLKALRNSHYFSEKIKEMKDQDLIKWIKDESVLTQDEKLAIIMRVTGKAKSRDTAAFTAEVEQLEKLRLNKKTEWICEAIGAEAFNFIRELGEVDDVRAAAIVGYVRREMQLKKIANCCSLIGSMLTLIAVGFLVKGGDLKKYAYLFYALSAALLLPGAALHLKIYQHQDDYKRLWKSIQ